MPTVAEPAGSKKERDALGALGVIPSAVCGEEEEAQAIRCAAACSPYWPVGVGAWRHSPTWDEVAFLPAGISHWQFGRFDLYNVNPPLVRMVAALPVVLATPETDWSRYKPCVGHPPNAQVGRDFIQANGRRVLLALHTSELDLHTFQRVGRLPVLSLGS